MRVLIVENDPDTACALAMLLKIAACDVRVAYDGQAALAEATAFNPDLMLADIGLRGMDGNELARRIRATRSLDNTILAAVTGYADEKNRQLAYAAGFDEYLVKPVHFDRLRELLDHIAHLLAQSKEMIGRSRIIARESRERLAASRSGVSSDG